LSAAHGGAWSPKPLARHTLVWPAAAARADLLAQAQDAAAHAAVARWLAAARPLVVRRVETPEPRSPAEVALGLPLPPAEGRRRLAFVLGRRFVARYTEPVPLAAVAAALPPHWQVPLAVLDRDARALGLTLRVFGSAAWQALTGLAYLHEGSDVDLVVRPESPAQLDALPGLLATAEARMGRRIDAEIVFADGWAVAWREWRNADGGDARVLAKSAASAALFARADLLASFASVPA